MLKNGNKSLLKPTHIARKKERK